MLPLASGFALLACSAEPAPDPAPPLPPSILVVVLDTVRADRVPADGALAALAERGRLYTDVTAPGSWTWPSHASLFTGVPPWVHGAHAAAPGEGLALRDTIQVTPLSDALPTFAERLAAGGYRTRAVVANRLLAAPLGLTRGFEEVVHHGSDGAVMAAALAAMPGEQPLLLFVNLMTAHSPYFATTAADAEAIAAQPWTEPFRTDPPGLSFFREQPSGVEQWLAGELTLPPEGLALLSRLYDQEVRVVDGLLGALVEAWDQHRPGGAIVVTSDHGEYLGEHGLLDHSATLYPEVTRVPLVAVGAGLSGREGTPVGLAHAHDLVLAQAGLAPLPSAGGTIQAAAWPRAHLASADPARHADPWRLHRDAAEAVLVHGEAVELYDLEADPWMTADLATERAERTAALAETARREIDVTPVPGGLAVEEGVLEQLEALGYIQ